MNSVSQTGDELKRDSPKVSQVGEKSTKNENPPSLPPPLPTIDALALTLKRAEGGDVDETKEEEATAIDSLKDIEVDVFVMDRNHDHEKPVALDFDLNELPSEVDQDWW
ncbi:hypothetical protein PIB30_005444 [Stylosanthes scabra]|uniref:Uncharacterized protein n=1 Tax=Stylosanthes scabra TaxID=79078 RepID=A0ABU6Y2S6_9FABA|nr:hypothetical protein [Stylosanthes scabra]